MQQQQSKQSRRHEFGFLGSLACTLPGWLISCFLVRVPALVEAAIVDGCDATDIFRGNGFAITGIEAFGEILGASRGNAKLPVPPVGGRFMTSRDDIDLGECLKDSFDDTDLDEYAIACLDDIDLGEI
ncbi:MAG: hypothetical protein M1835_007953 [Candelina submexicana]|nr:MAG: hypothetical protein M1835_007953 [Candelina submexicana]